MIFVINKLKYDTDKMDLISEKCQYAYQRDFLGQIVRYRGKDVKLYRSKFGRWLLTYKTDCSTYAIALDEIDAKRLLLEYDWETYEKIYGELEEA